MRVLLIEPESATAQSIELMLKSEGFGVYRIDRGEEGIELGRHFGYDAILLEAVLPDISGFEAVRQLRAAKVEAAILIVSGLAGVDDKVRGLRLGADDYLAKPFHKDELVARIHAVARRRRGHVVSTITCGELAVDVEAKVVRYADRVLNLSRKEYELLELLALRQGSAITRGAVFDYLYGGRDEPDSNIVNVFMHKLRDKLTRASGGLHFVETVRGHGYVMHKEPFAGVCTHAGVFRAAADTFVHPRPGAPTRPVAHAAA